MSKKEVTIAIPSIKTLEECKIMESFLNSGCSDRLYVQFVFLHNPKIVEDLPSRYERYDTHELLFVGSPVFILSCEENFFRLQDFTDILKPMLMIVGEHDIIHWDKLIEALEFGQLHQLDAIGLTFLSTQHHASGAVSLKTIDAGAQENARQATWSGEGAGSLTIAGPPVDLSRQTTGDMAVTIRYRVDASPEKPVSLGLACGESCGATVDVTSTLSGVKRGEWRTAKIKLSCFKAKGADMTHVSSPFALSTAGRMTLSFTEIKLASNEGDAFCPPD